MNIWNELWGRPNGHNVFAYLLIWDKRGQIGEYIGGVSHKYT